MQPRWITDVVVTTHTMTDRVPGLRSRREGFIGGILPFVDATKYSQED